MFYLGLTGTATTTRSNKSFMKVFCYVLVIVK